jgi:AraC-like DNA-binding protein
MLDALGHDQEVPGPQLHIPFSHLHRQATRDDEEELVCIDVLVPDPLALDLDELHLAVVQLGDDLGPPEIVEPAQALFEIHLTHVTGPAVDNPDIEDPTVVQGMHALHRRLADPDETLAAESALAIMTARLLEHLGRPRDEAVERSNGGLASDLRDLLDERRFERITLAEAGRILHASPAHLVRCFSRTFGIAPHRYLVARRVEAARWRLLEGEPVAQVAAAVGFYDQAHLTRHFKRHVGTTPAHYASRKAR